MILEPDIRNQLDQYLQLMENDIVIKVSAGSDTNSQDMLSLINEIASLSPKIKVEKAVLPKTPSFSINRMNEDTGIIFAGIPLGHEFSSLVLALLQVSGRPPKLKQKSLTVLKI